MRVLEVSILLISLILLLELFEFLLFIILFQYTCTLPI